MLDIIIFNIIIISSNRKPSSSIDNKHTHTIIRAWNCINFRKLSLCVFVCALRWLLLQFDSANSRRKIDYPFKIISWRNQAMFVCLRVSVLSTLYLYMHAFLCTVGLVYSKVIRFNYLLLRIVWLIMTLYFFAKAFFGILCHNWVYVREPLFRMVYGSCI